MNCSFKEQCEKNGKTVHRMNKNILDHKTALRKYNLLLGYIAQ